MTMVDAQTVSRLINNMLSAAIMRKMATEDGNWKEEQSWRYSEYRAVVRLHEMGVEMANYESAKKYCDSYEQELHSYSLASTEGK